MRALPRGGEIRSRGARVSPGMFAPNPAPPQSPGEVATGALILAPLAGEDPGLRVAETTGRRLFFGGIFEPQQFIAPAQPNSPENLEAASLQLIARRTLSRFRGTRTPEVVE